MCGILGTINRPFSAGALDLLSHRGPDDSGLVQCSVGHHLVTLGHRRLAIVDLSPAGRQPMWTPSRKHAVVFNGEVYNHLELRTNAPAQPYAGHSDTETILHYLATRGVSSLIQFNGIFALAFLDTENRRLFLARDPFGVKPLYYCSDEESLVFASEVRPVQALVNDAIEVAHVAELLRLRYLPAPDTLFKNIRKLRPGHVLEVDMSGRELLIREFPFLAAPRGELQVRNRAEALEEYAFLLSQAVKRQMMSDVEVGVFLSGGIDSALVATLARPHTDYRMKAFTVGFLEPDSADEIVHARETAQFAGLDHYDIRMSFLEFLDTLPRITAIIEEPLATTSVIPMFFLARLASQHVKVVLSGQGADECMGGYRRYQAELFRSLVPSFAIPCLRTMLNRLHVGNDVILRGLDSFGEIDDVRRFEAIYTVFTTDQIVRLLGYHESSSIERIRYFFELLRCSDQPHSAQRMMSLDLRMNLADDLLLYTDKITMHHSMECRVPFLDIDLVRFVESLPCAHRIGFFRGKILHKQAARRILPATIIGRKKKGFLSPTSKWFRASRSIADILLDRSSRFSCYFDLTEVEKILKEHAAGLNRERHIFLLLSLYYWMAGNSSSERAPQFQPLDLSTSNITGLSSPAA